MAVQIGADNTLDVRVLPSGRIFKLIKPFNVETSFGLKITVPVGFETDFASVPRIFWRIVPPWGKYSPAAVVHDFLYSSKIVDRKKADNIFLELMEHLGVSKWKRSVMYRAVRSFGSFYWNKNLGQKVE